MAPPSDSPPAPSARARVASLLPSATEIVCAVGARAELVGVSHECDHPPGVGDLPALTRPRNTLPGTSAEIDRSLREIVELALGVYEIELDALRAARPTVVVTQDLCDVCAVSLDVVEEALRELGLAETRIVSCKPTRLADVWDDVRRVGAALGRSELAEEVAARLAQRAAGVAERVPRSGKPRVLTVEWIAPVMIGGTWMPELVELAGGEALVTRPGEHAPTLSLEELRELEPDAVLVKPCGFKLEQSMRELETLRSALPWREWSAVQSGDVFLADGNAFFNRPGPRLVESLELLASCLWPEELAEERARHTGSVRRVRSDLELVPV